MSYAASEKIFYQRHYNGALEIGSAVNYDKIYLDNYAPGKRYQLICELLDPAGKYGTAVEIGCATGETILYLSQKYQCDHVFGFDIGFPDDFKLEVGGVVFQNANSNHPLPLETSSVDILVAMMVIEHLFDPFESFAEVRRLLSPGGKAFINLPLVTALKNRLRLLAGKLPTTSVPVGRWFDDREWDGNHLHYFSVDSIKQLAGMHGMKLTHMSGVGSHHKIKSMAPSFLASELSFVLERSDT
jgi:SAM-dependent methyltransferase